MNALDQLKNIEATRGVWANQQTEWDSYLLLRDHGPAIVELIEAAQAIGPALILPENSVFIEQRTALASALHKLTEDKP